MNDTKHAKNTKHAELRALVAVVIAVAMFIGVLIAVAWLREGQGPIQGPPQQGLQDVTERPPGRSLRPPPG